MLKVKHKFINIFRQNTIRFNVLRSSSTSINEQLKFPAYQPKNIENVKDFKQPTINNSNDRTFSMIFPPPNVTGNIHLGHCLTATIQDVLVKWKQEKGENTQWIFGVDHAGIATQVVVEKILSKKYGKTRNELGREAFLEEVLKWKHEKSSEIAENLRKMGTSFNWEKEYFTMDKKHSEAVNEAFVRLFEKGVIYRDSSLINWSCSLESAISDVEVDNLSIEGKTQLSIPNYQSNVTFGVLYEIAYKIVGSEEEIVVATTRPETLLGDTAIAVNPSDPRYAHLSNKKVFHPYRNEEIPIIFDDSVDPQFGTGALKITPAHDRNDFDVARRHKLKSVQVFTDDGKIRDEFPGFSQLPRFTARDKILNDLAEKNLLKNVKDHNMILPICSRSKDVIEFMLKEQWFINCKGMAARAAEAVKSGKIKIIPEGFQREWYRWLDNNSCRDWCISRQLWWGHQIPVYKVTKSDGSSCWIAGRSDVEIKNKINSDFTSIVRDSDVLDTWFSSALLPFSTNGWPGKIDNKNFPLSLMETGHDILFFWVARMVMMSLELTNNIPFKEVLLHGIVCDAFGRKMSKSLGNVIAPDQIIYGASLSDLQSQVEESVKRGIIDKSEREKSLNGQKKMFPNGIQECGVDALRFTLCSQNIKQHFINFDVNECVTNKLFFNKIWQATKYAINYAEMSGLKVSEIKMVDGNLNSMDRWILSRLANTIKTVDNSLENYNFHLAVAALKTFFYNNFCDTYLETTKVYEGSEKVSAASVLNVCLALGLQKMKIFTPYLAEELLPYLPKETSLDTEKFINNELEVKINDLLEVCKNIRELKAHLKATKKSKAEIVILTNSEGQKNFLLEYKKYLEHLTFSDDILITTSSSDFGDFSATSTAGHICSVGIKLLDSAPSSKEVKTLNRKKLDKLESELTNLLSIINNEGYREKASEKVQKKHQEKIAKTKAEIENMKKMESH